MADFTTSKVDGNAVSASEWNQLADLDNLVSTSGQTNSTSNLFQSCIASARYASAGQFFTDSGSANAYVLSSVSPFKSPVSSGAGEGYFNGMIIRYRAGNANTGASTVNVNGAGVINIKKADGTTDPDRGQISTTEDTVLRYNGTSFIIIDKRANTPAFHITLSANQNIGNATITKIQVNTEVLDTHNYFDNTTNYRFTPLIAGWYFIAWGGQFVDAGVSAQGCSVYLYKNGVVVKAARSSYFSGGNEIINANHIVYMNGSTDYLEFYADIGGVSANTIVGNNDTYFMGFKLNI